LFWENKEELLSSDSATCESLAKDIVESSKVVTERNQTDPQAFTFVDESKIANDNVNVAFRIGNPEECWNHFDVVINCTEHEYEENKSEVYRKRYLHLNIPASKRGQHELLKCIPTALDFCKEPILASKTILVHCAEGKFAGDDF
jgi:tRNA A64-2'-O-ribosylphosphate transferase